LTTLAASLVAQSPAPPPGIDGESLSRLPVVVRVGAREFDQQYQ
jgi:hypothetical protein